MTLTLQRVVTARALSVALERALPTGVGLRTQFAAEHGLTLSTLCKSLDSRSDTPGLRRCARAVGYEAHPTMPGWYRRVEVGPNPMEA